MWHRIVIEPGYGNCQTKVVERRGVVISARVVIKRSPFRFFKTSPEIMRLAVRMYVRNPQFTEEIRKLGCALA